MQLPIKGLDFNEIKSNFISYLKTQSFYTDYNFEASGISSLINLFAYFAHYIGYYIKMAYTESFIDGATKRESLMSKAKLNGYLPKGKRAARAVVNLSIQLDTLPEPDNQIIIIPKYSLFFGTNSTNDSRTFYCLEDIICHDKTGTVYKSPNFQIYEGNLKTWKSIVKAEDIHQRFIIGDANIDCETLRVYVYPDQYSDIKAEYLLVTDVFDTERNDKVFYLSANNEGLYEIFFGNNVIGHQPENNSIIEMVYLSTNGPGGNGCTKMSYQRPSAMEPGTTGAYLNFSVVVVERSSGGMNMESIQSLRTNIPSHYKRQKRSVTESDYKSLILDTYRDVDSINIWGGEKNYPPDNGAVYISIKPKLTDTIGRESKNEIIKLLKSNGVVGIYIKMVDPEYINIQISIFVKYDPSMTNKSVGDIRKLVANKVVTYNSFYLSKFEKGLSNIDLLDYVRKDEPYISRIYSECVISKSIDIVYLNTSQYIINFGNKLDSGVGLSSSTFTYAGMTCHLLSDLNGNIWFANESNNIVLNKPVGEINYDKGIIKFILNHNIKSSIDHVSYGTIILYAKPSLPDVETYLHNIVNISKVSVNVEHK